MSKKNKSEIPILIKNSNRKINSEVMSTYEQIKQSGRREGTIEHILNMYKKDISPTSFLIY